MEAEKAIVVANANLQKKFCGPCFMKIIILRLIENLAFRLLIAARTSMFI